MFLCSIRVNLRVAPVNGSAVVGQTAISTVDSYCIISLDVCVNRMGRRVGVDERKWAVLRRAHKRAVC